MAAALPAVDLLEVSLAGSGDAALLRAVIDHPDGVDHDLCVAVTRALDEAGLRDRFGIEVSSPGPEPPMRTVDHFRRAVGRRVRLKVRSDDGGRGSRTGTLTAADPERVSLDTDEGRLEIQMADIRRAHLLERFPAGHPAKEGSE